MPGLVLFLCYLRVECNGYNSVFGCGVEMEGIWFCEFVSQKA